MSAPLRLEFFKGPTYRALFPELSGDRSVIYSCWDISGAVFAYKALTRVAHLIK